MPWAATELKSFPPMVMLEKMTMAFGFFASPTLFATSAMFCRSVATSFSAFSSTPKTLPMSRSSV